MQEVKPTYTTLTHSAGVVFSPQIMGRQWRIETPFQPSQTTLSSRERGGVGSKRSSLLQ